MSKTKLLDKAAIKAARAKATEKAKAAFDEEMGSLLAPYTKQREKLLKERQTMKEGLQAIEGELTDVETIIAEIKGEPAPAAGVGGGTKRVRLTPDRKMEVAKSIVNIIKSTGKDGVKAGPIKAKIKELYHGFTMTQVKKFLDDHLPDHGVITNGKQKAQTKYYVEK